MINIPTLLVLLLIIVAIVFAVRYTRRHGSCDACGDAGLCSGHCSTPHKDKEYEKAIRKIQKEQRKSVWEK